MHFALLDFQIPRPCLPSAKIANNGYAQSHYKVGFDPPFGSRGTHRNHAGKHPEENVANIRDQRSKNANPHAEQQSLHSLAKLSGLFSGCITWKRVLPL